MKSNIPTTFVFCFITGLTVHFSSCNPTAGIVVFGITSVTALFAYMGGRMDGNEEEESDET